MENQTNSKLTVYGTVWCGTSNRAKRILDNNKISYEWIDIDQSPEGARIVEKINNGNRSVPTIIFPDGSILVEPSSDVLMKKLGLA